MSDSENVLIVADSDRDANMLYAVGMFTPDPFIYFRIDGKSHIVVTDLEVDRARKKAAHCRVLSYSQCVEKPGRKTKQPGMAKAIDFLFRERHLRKVFVPANFPHGLARELRNYKIKVRVKKGGVFPQREFKTPEEIKKISGALMMAEVGLAEGIQALKTSKIQKDGKLSYHGVTLSSEKLRGIIETAIVQVGGMPCHTIVAGGRQGCDPHETGHGPLRANEPIVLDVFPRSSKTGYFGDITRTVVRGRASEAARRAYDTVARAQEIAFTELKPGMAAAQVHKVVEEFFESQGFKTCRKTGRAQGFFHGTGQGLGMELHEPPRLGMNSTDVLAAGHVVTIEPGLYYSDIGGIRLEDVVAITPQGPKNLTKFEKTLEV